MSTCLHCERPVAVIADQVVTVYDGADVCGDSPTGLHDEGSAWERGADAVNTPGRATMTTDDQLAVAIGDLLRIDDEACEVISTSALTFNVRYDDGEVLTWDIGYTPFERLGRAA